MDFERERMQQKESEILILRNDVDRAKEENLVLKAAVKEGDKTREVLARQMTHAMQQEMQLAVHGREHQQTHQECSPTH